MSHPIYYIGGVIAATGERLDLAVEGGRIVESSASILPPDGAEINDIAGKLILPGMCDLHVHFNPASGTKAQTRMGGEAAALAGGVTRLLSMPAAKPPIDRLSAVVAEQNLNAELSGIKVHQSAAITEGFDGESLSNFHELMNAGVRVLCDPGRPIENPAVLRRALDYARDFDLVFALCSETSQLTASGGINEGRISYELGLPGIPVCGEDIAVARDVRIAESVDSQIHVQCLTSRGSVATVRRAKKRGAKVTTEVGIHHLLFTEEAIGDFDTTYKISPPLRLKEDCDALVDGLKDGTVDCLVSAHLPQTEFSKAQDFLSAKSGMTGLSTTLLAAFDRLICTGKLSWSDLVRIYSENPRKILGLPPVSFGEGAEAEFVVFDSQSETEIPLVATSGQSSNTPFKGQVLKGEIVQTVS